MKKWVVTVAVAGLGLSLAACGTSKDKATNSKSSGDKSDKVITVASQTTPMTDVVKLAAKVAKADGWDIKLVQVTDNVAYNDMVSSGEADASFAEHKPYTTKYNKEKQAKLVAVQPIYNAKVGFYSKEYKAIDKIPDGSKVAIPNDPSNQGRALAILAEQNLITLTAGVGANGTIKDVTANPKHLEWLQVDLLNLSEAYSEPGVALVYNYPTYIAKLGLKPSDALFLEKKIDDRFAIQVVAREDNEQSDKIKALKKAMTSQTVRDFLEKEHSATLIPAF